MYLEFLAAGGAVVPGVEAQLGQVEEHLRELVMEGRRRAWQLGSAVDPSSTKQGGLALERSWEDSSKVKNNLFSTSPPHSAKPCPVWGPPSQAFVLSYPPPNPHGQWLGCHPGICACLGLELLE
jgi:hypothetical protein